MINKGMDNDAQMLQGLVDRADARIAQIKSGEKPALAPMQMQNMPQKLWLTWFDQRTHDR